MTSNTIECLNCGNIAHDSFCASCGQKTKIHPHNFWSLAIEFIADYFHYDNKFFKTIKTLTVCPGKLTQDYRSGKRAAYLHPIQLYIFMSALGFIVFYSAFKPVVLENQDGFSINWIVGNAGIESIADYDYYDTIAMKQPVRIGTKAIMDTAAQSLGKTSIAASTTYILTLFYSCFAYYAYHKHLFLYSQALSQLLNTYTHSIPKLFFILMPVFGVLLSLFFRKKELTYTDHAIMSLHFHSFVFLIVIITILLYYLPGIPFYIPIYLLLFVSTAYFFLCCHRFYKRHWLPTLLRGSTAWVLYLFIVWIVSILNLFIEMRLA